VIREYSRRVMASPLRLEDYEVAELYQAPGPGGGDRGDAGEGDREPRRAGRSRPTSIQILRIREGHIVLFRDFADPPVPGRRDRGTASGKLTWIPDVGPCGGGRPGAGEPAVRTSRSALAVQAQLDQPAQQLPAPLQDQHLHRI